MNGDVLNSLFNGAFISGTTETRDVFFSASWNRRRTALLKTNDITSEAKAKVTWIGTRNLLGRNIHFAFK